MIHKRKKKKRGYLKANKGFDPHDKGNDLPLVIRIEKPNEFYSNADVILVHESLIKD